MNETPSPIRVGLVGHCLPDAYALRASVGRALGAVEFATINDERSLAEGLAGLDLVLVNRALDGEFPDEGGVALIRRIDGGRTERGPVILLISNYADAQAEAVAAGAQPGFGKTDLNSERAKAALRGAMEAAHGRRADGPRA